MANINHHEVAVAPPKYKRTYARDVLGCENDDLDDDDDDNAA